MSMRHTNLTPERIAQPLLDELLQNIINELQSENEILVSDKAMPTKARQLTSKIPQTYIYEEVQYSTLADKVLYTNLLGNSAKKPQRTRLEPVFSVSNYIRTPGGSKQNSPIRTILIYTKDEKVNEIAEKHLIPIVETYNAKVIPIIGF
jgi:hypothetical protein